jgi:hypothetical protein
VLQQRSYGEVFRSFAVFPIDYHGYRHWAS